MEGGTSSLLSLSSFPPIPSPPFDRLRTWQAQGPASSGTALNGLTSELAVIRAWSLRPLKGVEESKGRGDIGVRFDKLNELRDGKVSELARV